MGGTVTEWKVTPPDGKKDKSKWRVVPPAPPPDYSTTEGIASAIFRALEPGRFGHAVAQGATFGASDEIAAGLESAGAYLRGDDSAAAYDNTLNQMRGTLKDYRRDNPAAAVAGELLGGVAVPGVGFTKAMDVASPLLRYGAALPALGGTYGALSGFLSGEGQEDRLRGAAVGGIGGAVASPLLVGGLELGGKALRAVGDMAGIGLNAENRAAQAVLSRVGNSADDLAKAEQFIQQGFDAGSAPALMDYNDALAMVTGSAGRTPGQSGGMLGRFLAERQDAQGQRLSNLFDDVTGITTSATSVVDDLSKSQKALAGPLYQAADPVMIPSQNLGPMLDDPALMLGLKKGITEELRKLRADAALAMNAGDATKATALQTQIDDLVGIGAKLGDEWPSEVPTRWLDLARRGLGDMIEAGKRTGSEPVGSLIQAKDALTKIVSDVNPDYGKAIAAWAGPAALKDAVEEGTQFFASGKIGPDDVAAIWQGMTPEKQQAFKVGVVDYIRGVARGADGKNKVAALLGNENMRQKLAQIFTPDEMARIEAFRTTERAMTEATRKAIGGSPTAKNQAADADFATDASAITDLLSPGGWGRQLANKALGVFKGMPDAVAQNVVKTTATNTAQEALDQIARLRAVAAAQALKQANPFRNPYGLAAGITAAPSTSEWLFPLLWAALPDRASQ